MISAAAIRRQLLQGPIGVSYAAHRFAIAGATAQQRWSSGDSTGNSSSSTSKSSEYDREADLKREEEAKQKLFTHGMPNPFKQQQGQGTSTQQAASNYPGTSSSSSATGNSGSKPPFGQEGWAPPRSGQIFNEAWRQASLQFFGTEKPPSKWSEWTAAAREHAARGGRPAPAGGSTDSSSTNASTSATTSTGSTDATANSTAGASSTTSGSSGSGSPFGGGQAPPFTPPFKFGMAHQYQTGGVRSVSMGRLLAGLVIVYCSFWMMRRLGMTGNFNHVHVPYWAMSAEEQAKWMIFILNIDEPRRVEIQKGFEAVRASNPYLSFFDYVDSVQSDWASTPSYSKDEVIRAVSSLVRTESGWRAMATLRAGFDSAGGMFSYLGMGGSGDTTLTPYQKRIESMMRLLPSEHTTGGIGGGGATGGWMGGGAKPIIMARSVPAPGYGGQPSAWTPVPQHQQSGGGQYYPYPPQQQQQHNYSSYPSYQQHQPQQYGGYGGQQQQQQQWPPAQAGHGQVYPAYSASGSPQQWPPQSYGGPSSSASPNYNHGSNSNNAATSNTNANTTFSHNAAAAAIVPPASSENTTGAAESSSSDSDGNNGSSAPAS